MLVLDPVILVALPLNVCMLQVAADHIADDQNLIISLSSLVYGGPSSEVGEGGTCRGYKGPWGGE